MKYRFYKILIVSILLLICSIPVQLIQAGISGGGSGSGGIESDPVTGAVNGIVKADGAGAISRANAGVDYQSPVTVAAPILKSLNNQILMYSATDARDGYLTKEDRSAFNAKQNAGNYLTDAPNDGKSYSRKSESWSEITDVDSVPYTAVSPILKNLENAFLIYKATDSVDGYLSKEDWSAFDAKTVSYQEKLTVDGEGDTSFTLANTPYSTANLKLYLNGQLAYQNASGDYTVSGTTITWTGTAIKAADVLIAVYGTTQLGEPDATTTSKGMASFTPADFDVTAGNVAIDYTNGQAASAGAKGFLTSANWSTFNGKAPIDNPSFTTGITAPQMSIGAGSVVNECSIDGTMSGNSDSAVPTEQAVKTYLTSTAYFPEVTNLTCFRTADTNNIDLNFDSLNVGGYKLTSGDLTIDTNAGTGINTLDTGSLANNTWYAIHVIYKPSTATIAGLISLSRTTPTLPANYTVFRCIGWCHTATSATTIRAFHYNGGGWWMYDTYTLIINGGTQTDWTAVDMSGYAPTTSLNLKLILQTNRALDLNGIYTKATGDTDFENIVYAKSTGVTAMQTNGNVNAACNSSQSIDYKLFSAANSGTGSILFCGYQDNITPQ